MDDGEYEEILEDMKEECQKFGMYTIPLSFIMLSLSILVYLTCEDPEL